MSTLRPPVLARHGVRALLGSCLLSALPTGIGTLVAVPVHSEDVESRLDSLEALAAQRPGDAAVQAQLGKTLAEAGLDSRAADAYRQALTLDPTLLDVQFMLGLSSLKIQHFEDAIEAFDKAAASPTYGADAMLLEANTLATLGRVSDAKAVLRRVPEDSPTARATALLELARLSLRDGHLEEAEDALDRASAGPLSRAHDGTRARLATELLFQRGTLRVAQDRTVEAIEAFEAVLLQQPAHREAHYALASAYRRLRQPSRAALHEQRFMALRESPAVAGERALRDGRADEASVLLRHAVEVEPDNASAHYNLGVALERLGKTSEAMQSYRLALSNEPGYEDASFNLGRLELDRGRTDEALARFETISRMNPSSADAFYFLGRAYEQDEQLDSAANALGQAAALDPNDAQTVFALGALALKRNAPQEARTWFEKAAALAPENPRVHHNLGAILQQSGELKAAAESLDLAVRLDPRLLQSWLLLGQCHEALGAPSLARNAYRQVLDLDPSHEMARARLTALSRIAP